MIKAPGSSVPHLALSEAAVEEKKNSFEDVFKLMCDLYSQVFKSICIYLKGKVVECK